MKEVTFLTTMAGKNILYVAGKHYELDKKQAQKFIDAGICKEYVKQVDEVVRVKTTVVKAKKVKKR